MTQEDKIMEEVCSHLDLEQAKMFTKWFYTKTDKSEIEPFLKNHTIPQIVGFAKSVCCGILDGRLCGKAQENYENKKKFIEDCLTSQEIEKQTKICKNRILFWLSKPQFKKLDNEKLLYILLKIDEETRSVKSKNLEKNAAYYHLYRDIVLFSNDILEYSLPYTNEKGTVIFDVSIKY